MTNRAALVLAACIAAVVVAGGACYSFGLARLPCSSDAACPDELRCVDGACTPAEGEGDAGEGEAGEGEGEAGEGEGGEGEGDAGEGEGDAGEGEGDAGEGEGDAGEGEGDAGEGEGDAGEGEGEGEPPCAGDFLVDTVADTVDALADGVCADAAGACSLRAAVGEAALRATTTVCMAPGLRVVLAGALTVDAFDVVIDGGGGAIAGAGSDRLFRALNGARLAFKRVTLTGGRSTTFAAAVEVRSGARLSLIDSVVSQNITTTPGPDFNEGGAITTFDDAHVDAVRTTFSLNRLDTPPNLGRGGAIAIHSGGSLSLLDCVFDRNHTDSVGGAFFVATLGANVSVERTTFTGNTTNSRGAAVDVNCGTTGTLHFVNDTFFDNDADELIFVCGDETVELDHCTFAGNNGPLARLDHEESAPGTVQLVGSIIDDPLGVACDVNAVGSFASLGGNVTTSTDADCNFGPGDVVADAALATSLADNGGYCQTLAISATSPARGAAASVACPLTDARGYARNDGACDAGAYEEGAAP